MHIDPLNNTLSSSKMIPQKPDEVPRDKRKFNTKRFRELVEELDYSSVKKSCRTVHGILKPPMTLAHREHNPTPLKLCREESYPSNASSIHPQLKPGRIQQGSTFGIGNPTASNPAPQITATGSAAVSTVYPQYPNEAPCGQGSGNITGNSRRPGLRSSKQTTACLGPITSANGASRKRSSAKATVTEASAPKKADGIRSSGASKGKIVSDH